MPDKDQLYRNLNEGILAERLPAFERNLEKNLDLIRRHGGLMRILPDFEGKFAVVIGAGPSLERHYGTLRKYQDRRELVYVAVDMALRPLVRNGIRPRYVFSCETRPVDFFGGVDTSRMHLVAFSCVSNINARGWRGGMSFYNWMIRRPEYEPLWEKAGLDLGFVATGSLVTTQAVAFTLGCRITGLAMAGNDLAFGDRFYARESPAHAGYLYVCDRYRSLEAMEMSRSRAAREYVVRRGEKSFYTNNQFLAAKMWLEDLFNGRETAVYDASDPGCSEKYVAKIELRDLFYNLYGRKKRKRR